MMNSRRVMDYLSREPFRPFRISMVSGKTSDIRHPEMIFVGKTTARVHTALSDADGETNEQEQDLSIILIESIEVLEQRASKDQEANR